MSGAGKKSHEESSHSHTHSPSTKYTPSHEDPQPPLPPPPSPPPAFPRFSSDYRPLQASSYDVDSARSAKIPRTEPRDTDRRSPFTTPYRTPSSSIDPHLEKHVAADDRSELKDSRDHRSETRDTKTEVRDSRDSTSLNAKGEKDENSEVKNEAAKAEKDSYGLSGSHLSWKDSKEQHRGKRYSDAPPGPGDPWMSHGPVDHIEAHEAVGENRFDDKFKDKDRKRKDGKHRDWDKERVDRRSSMQIGNSSAEFKDVAKEERDTERWEREKERERERKDPIKDNKERGKEREKEHTTPKRDSWNVVEKDIINEKESGDTANRLQEPENNVASDKKRPVDKVEHRERRKERDADGEGDRERPEKRSRVFEKEADDGFTDADVAVEREREVYNNGVQQRKRMQRSRGSPQILNREPRFRAPTHDNEGSQVTGKAEVSSVIYKVGECMQELVKLWKDYEASQSEKNGESSSVGPTLEIRIPAEHVTATNRQVRGGQLWGTDIYTDDSDLVAVLMHTGYCRPTASPPPPAIHELQATIRVLPPQDCYISTLRNNVRSRAWGAAIGCSYRIERCCIVKKSGGSIDLEPCLTHISTVEPTLAPIAVERTMTTRAAASNALRQQRYVREVTIQYNLCNEPWIKYSISIVADKGLKKPLYTCARLKKGEVLYLETHSCRYELCFTGEKMVKAIQSNNNTQEAEADKLGSKNQVSHATNEGENVAVDLFRWARCRKPLPQKLMRSVGIPLPVEHVEVLEENLEWEDVQWSQTGVWIWGKEYTLARVHFLSNN